jgi:hypothetical protein
VINTLELVPVGNNLVSGGGDADVGDRENVLEEGINFSYRSSWKLIKM